ncbi:MAG: S41 family peptidase [Negativicutes bacterium]|nr:S41 family peptidase [Negativicutes bacterium]MBP9537528.1 S41 family peptidase [Negativicutes bacterium]MBP9949735.1 S41 family peptidase [Negativicutes bacterium]
MSFKKNIFKIIVIIAVTVFVVLNGLYFGLGFNKVGVVNTIKILGIYSLINKSYVNDVVSDKLVAGMIKGMVESLGDEHSIYLDKKMYQEMLMKTEGYFGGVGIVLGVKDKDLTVVAPIEDTPGFLAGIKPGDIIVAIDQINVKELSLEEAVNKIRGAQGSTVVLSIKRAEEIKDYILIRSNIEIKTVKGEILDNNVGYIRIAMFSEKTATELNKVYQELINKGATAFVLDLRSNPGGLLQASVAAANLFVPQGPVVSVVHKDGSKEVYSSNLASINYPLAVLINGGSASAAEILAGAIKDTNAGTLVGTKSYGKGSVQGVIPIGNAEAIKLTIAKYYTPSNVSIDGVGIEPNIIVELPKDAKTDVQLAKALAVVKNKNS